MCERYDLGSDGRAKILTITNGGLLEEAIEHQHIAVRGFLAEIAGLFGSSVEIGLFRYVTCDNMCVCVCVLTMTISQISRSLSLSLSRKKVIWGLIHYLESRHCNIEDILLYQGKKCYLFFLLSSESDLNLGLQIVVEQLFLIAEHTQNSHSINTPTRRKWYANSPTFMHQSLMTK